MSILDGEREAQGYHAKPSEARWQEFLRSKEEAKARDAVVDAAVVLISEWKACDLVYYDGKCLDSYNTLAAAVRVYEKLKTTPTVNGGLRGVDSAPVSTTDEGSHPEGDDPQKSSGSLDPVSSDKTGGRETGPWTKYCQGIDKAKVPEQGDGADNELPTTSELEFLYDVVKEFNYHPTPEFVESTDGDEGDGDVPPLSRCPHCHCFVSLAHDRDACATRMRGSL